MLTLPEHLLLLAMNDDKGTVVPSASVALPYGLAGAVMLELAHCGKIDLGGEHLRVLSTERTGDAILDAALMKLGLHASPRKPGYWIARPGHMIKNLKGRLLEQLVEREILKREEHKILWVFSTRRYPERDAAPERSVREHIREVVLHGTRPNDTAAMLIPLLSVCELTKEVFPEQPQREIKTRLKKIAADALVANAVRDQVAATTAAIVAASMSAIVMTTVMSSSSH